MRHILGGILLLAIVGVTAAQQTPVAPQTIQSHLQQTLQEAFAAHQRHDYQASREAALKATAIDPKNSSAWFYLAYAVEQLGDLSKAEEAYKTVINLSPRHTTAYNNLGYTYRRMGRLDEAIVYFRKQIEVTPRGRMAPQNLGLVLALRGEWEEARKFATLAAEISPDDVTRWTLLGRTQMKTGRFAEALGSFDRALALPHEPMLENNIAWEFADAGVSLDKSWQVISSALDRIRTTVCEPASLSAGDQCSAPLRQLAFALDTAGWVLYRQGKIEAAEPYLRSAIAITPRDLAELHMAIVLAKSGRLDEAVKLFARARVRPEFGRVDSSETMRELAKVAGGQAELDALLARAVAPSGIRDQAKVIALVDGGGKVIEAQVFAPAPAELAEAAKSLTLPALSWPGQSLRSIRTIEFRHEGNQWLPTESYVGVTLPPLSPCSSPKPLLPTLVTQDSTQMTLQRGCSGAF